jgi:surface antigen
MTNQSLAFLGLAGMMLAGCSSGANAPPPAPAAVAAEAPNAEATPSIVDPGMLGGVLAGSVGLGLENSDRVAAYQAQTAALDTSQRKSWRGQRGVYGYVEAGPQQGSCRPFTQTVYVAGRPYEGQGTACRQPDGGWRMTPG